MCTLACVYVCVVRVALASEAMYTHIYVVLNEMRVIVYNEMKCVLQGVVRTKPFGAGNIFLILAHPVYKM